MSWVLKKLILVLSLVALAGTTACIVRAKPGRDRHEVRHDRGKKKGHYKKHKKHRKQKKHKKHRRRY